MVSWDQSSESRSLEKIQMPLSQKLIFWPKEVYGSGVFNCRSSIKSMPTQRECLHTNCYDEKFTPARPVATLTRSIPLNYLFCMPNQSHQFCISNIQTCKLSIHDLQHQFVSCGDEKCYSCFSCYVHQYMMKGLYKLPDALYIMHGA